MTYKNKHLVDDRKSASDLAETEVTPKEATSPLSAPKRISVDLTATAIGRHDKCDALSQYERRGFLHDNI